MTQLIEALHPSPALKSWAAAVEARLFPHPSKLRIKVYGHTGIKRRFGKKS